jgi:hypothetical protein
MRQQQVVVGLLRVGALRAGTHDDAAVEHAARLTIEHAVEVLVALAVRLGVLDRSVVIDVLGAAEYRQAAENQIRVGAVEHGVDVMAHQSRAERHCREDEPRVPRLMEV